MAQTEQVLRKTYRLASSVQVGKFTVGKVDSGTYTDGFTLSSTANDGPLVGVALSSIIPRGQYDYSGGKYTTASGAAWPGSSTPTSPIGLSASFGVQGIVRCIAAEAITRGAQVNMAATTTINSVSVMGAVKTVSESSTTIFLVGIAETASSAAGDVIRVRLNLNPYKG